MVRHLGGTALKRNKDGIEVMSDYLEDGEELVTSSRRGDPEPAEETEPVVLTSIDGTNTIGSDTVAEIEEHKDDEPEEPEVTEPGPENTLTSVDGVNTVGGEVAEEIEAAEEEPADAEAQEEQAETPEPPSVDDNKQAWFDYAKNHRGYKGEKDDITKAEYIKQFGA